MKILTIVAFLFAICCAAGEELKSPDGQYEIEYDSSDPGKSGVRFKNAKTGKVLRDSFVNIPNHTFFHEIAWSQDSRYLAVIEGKTESMMEVAVFAFSPDSVEEVRLPDYRLNLLGRRLLVEGGRYHSVGELRWDERFLIFRCKGQWSDGPSDPNIDRDNWYHFEVSLAFVGRVGPAVPRLAAVAALEPEKEDE